MKFKCRCTWMYVKENLLVPNCRMYYSDFECNIYIYIYKDGSRVESCVYAILDST